MRGVLLVVWVGSAGIVGEVGAQGKPRPEGEVAAIVAAFLQAEKGASWESAEALPGITWAALPARELTNCLPDGSCYTRQGRGVVAGRQLAALATGARTILSYIYLRNGSAPFGEAAVVEALRGQGVSVELARCPVGKGAGGQVAGGTNWYRIGREGKPTAVLAVQTSCNGRPCEGFTLSHGEELPALQANQVALYSNQCAAGAARAPVSTKQPVEALADAVVALIPVSGAAGHEWKALAGLGGITWFGEGPKAGSLAHLNDRNPMMQTGEASYAERKFSAIASGTAAAAKVIYLEEGGLHPRGEHMLGVVYQRGFVVQLTRCGPVYTESTNNWYRVTSSRTQPVMIRQSIRYDGNNVQDSYELRLDGTLPTRDPRDREPGVSGCR